MLPVCQHGWAGSGGVWFCFGMIMLRRIFDLTLPERQSDFPPGQFEYNRRCYRKLCPHISTDLNFPGRFQPLIASSFNSVISSMA